MSNRPSHESTDVPQFDSLEPRVLLSGTSYLVNSLTDVVASDGVVTLREAIEAANTNLAVNEAPAGSATETDVITFDQAALELEAGTGNPLTIVLGGTQLEITDDLDVQGLGSDVLTIDAAGASRVISISGPDVEVTFNGLTVKGGSADLGGGIYQESGILTLTSVTVSGNSSTSDGSGIYLDSGTMTLRNVTVTENSNGGGICNRAGTLILINATVSGNSYSDGVGGGILNWFGVLTLINSTMSGNTATFGGAMENINGLVTLTNVAITGNTASNGAGAIYLLGGSMTLTNVTISGNAAQSYSGGIFSLGTLRLDNTIVALNDAPSSANIYGSFTNNSSMVNGDPSFVRNPSDGGDGWGDDPATPGVDEGANDDYGDLRLLPTSVAINTGDNALLPADEFDLDGDSDTAEALPVDLAGNQRIRNLTVDIGAYEYALPGDADDNGKVDGADLARWQRNYDPLAVNDNTFEMGDFDGNGKVDGADLAVWQRNYDPLGSGAVGLEPVADASPVGGKSGDTHVSPREDGLQSSLEPVPVFPAALGVSVIDDARKAGTGTSRFARLSQSPFFSIATARSHGGREELIQEEPVDVLAIAEIDVPLGKV